MNRPRQVLEMKFTQVVKLEFAQIGDYSQKGRRHHNAARGSDRLQACRDIDAMAVDIVQIKDDRLPMNADAKGYAALGRLQGFKPGDFTLQLGGTAKGIERALQHRDEAVAGVLHNLASSTDQGRIDDAHAKSPIATMRLDLSSFHKSGIADDVRHQDGAERSFEFEDRTDLGIKVLFGSTNQPRTTVVGGVRRRRGDARRLRLH